ncbi:MAG: acyl-CoA synthetase [Desulfuromonadales bacterium]|nr:MAG: acyl-CoA synthetase [Desulfuromonadales bacterium]
MTRTAAQLERFLSSREGQREGVPEPEVKGLLRELGLPVPAGIFIPAGDPVPSPFPLPFPLVAKVVSPAIASKSDVGGVRIGIGDRNELAAAVANLSAIAAADGVLVEEQARPGVEVIVGGIVDPQFGPVVMVGLGGLFVELFRDVAFALAPLERNAARRLVGRMKGAAVLGGYRGRAPVDGEALVSVIVTVSELIGSGIIGEIDLNPVILCPDGAMVVDAKMTVLGTSRCACI